MRKFLQVFYFIITALSALAFITTGAVLIISALGGVEPNEQTNNAVLWVFGSVITFVLCFNTGRCLEDKDT